MSLETNIYFGEHVAVSLPITLSKQLGQSTCQKSSLYCLQCTYSGIYELIMSHIWCFDNSFKCSHHLPKRHVHHDMTANKDDKVIAVVHNNVYLKRTCLYAGRTTSKHSLRSLV